MCALLPDVLAKELVMPSKKLDPPRKKITFLPSGSEPRPPGAWSDTNGLTGEGSESVIVHLRELEQLKDARRLEKAGKDKGE
jgi:hypothetical protein